MNTIQAFIIGFILAFILATVIWSFVFKAGNLRIIRDFIRFVLILALIVAFGYLVYPTPYHYSMSNGKYPVVINWITGETKILVNSNWVEVKEGPENKP